MDILRPQTPDQLAEGLAHSASSGKSIRLVGAFTKDRMGGPIVHSDVCVSTSKLDRVIQYEPRDLTISVEAGMPWAKLTNLLAANHQMIPLDPPFSDSATVGGILASNSNGPRRRLYGTARDVVIGMKFATLEGRLIQSGGMVVKNVAGLDMGKVMIGSFGTLAAIAIVNFKLTPIPHGSRTIILNFADLDEAITVRNRILESVLQPAAFDLLNPAASTLVDRTGYNLLLEASGNNAVLDRYTRELSALTERTELLPTAAAAALWTRIREFTPSFLKEHSSAAVIRYSTTIAAVKDALGRIDGPAIARAGSGIVYGYYADAAKLPHNGSHGTVIEFAPQSRKSNLDLWPSPGADLQVMKKIKDMFDPKGLLNKGRLYGRI